LFFQPVWYLWVLNNVPEFSFPRHCDPDRSVRIPHTDLEQCVYLFEEERSRLLKEIGLKPLFINSFINPVLKAFGTWQWLKRAMDSVIFRRDLSRRTFISLTCILPRLSSRSESIRKTSGLQSNLLLFAFTNKAICQKNHPRSWKGASRRGNPYRTNEHS
jgi:hypothetical protein